MSKLSREMKILAKQAGGSHKPFMTVFGLWTDLANIY